MSALAMDEASGLVIKLRLLYRVMTPEERVEVLRRVGDWVCPTCGDLEAPPHGRCPKWSCVNRRPVL